MITNAIGGNNRFKIMKDLRSMWFISFIVDVDGEVQFYISFSRGAVRMVVKCSPARLA